MSGDKSTPPTSGNFPFGSAMRSPRRNKRKIIYSDRYIPARSGMNLQAAFTLDHHSNRNSTGQSLAGSDDAGIFDLDPTGSELDSMKANEANKTFDAVLKTELFGPMSADSDTGRNSQSSMGGSSAMDTSMDVDNRPSNGLAPGVIPGTVASSNDVSSVIAAATSGAPSSGNGVTGSTSPDASTSGTPGSMPQTPRTPRQRRNVFRYQSPTKSRPTSSSMSVNNELYSLSPVGHDSEKILLSPQRKPRAIPKVPYRVLDAPELADDFYLNLVDWGSQDILGVGLGSCVYLWDASTGSVNRLCDLGPGDTVTSVAWIGAGTHLAVGTTTGLVEIWDAATCRCTRTMTGHTARCSSLSGNRHILTSGSRDRTILHRDVREPAHYMKRLTYHRQEVCGLKWNVEENKLASGGNDNRLYVWDGLEERPLYQFNEHRAAVKAIAWSPHQRGILASGGGTADRHIKIWNTITGLKVHDVDTGSQVCNLAWSKTSNELVSTHGYSRNQIAIWKYSSMQQIASLTGHTYRVLYLAMSPDGQTIVTGAGDETLRFWNVFEKAKADNNSSSVLFDAFSQLR